MKEMSKMIVSNINNLTSLWKTAGVPFDTYTTTPEFDYCLAIKKGDWPNRLWFHKKVEQKNIDLTKEKIRTSGLVVPHWDIKGGDSYQLFEKNGFKLKFEQVGMHLRLHDFFEIEKTVTIKPVTKEEEASIWAELYPMAFGYRISSEILMRTQKDIQYHLAYYQNQPIATIIVHQTGKITGVHGIGVIPTMRKRGFAGQIMKLLINDAITRGSEYMTLQASAMGKNIYLGLGFEEQFIIKNYII